MNNICVIGVYFGQFKNYFSLWLKSCAKNPSIDFRIYTDNEYKYILPANVTIVHMTLSDFSVLASKKLGVAVNIQRPYKCCDFKPMYGVIFEDDLVGYDYWGECDFDLIWGDLRTFLELNNFKHYDKFLPLGHLSFYRNTPFVNKAFMMDGDECGGWKKVVQSNENLVFDEIPGICQIYIKNELSFFFKKLFADITPIYKRFQLSEYCTINGDRQYNYEYQLFYWDNGRVFRAYIDDSASIAVEELMYIHFRSRPNFDVSESVLSSDSFYITNSGFHIKNSDVTIEDIQKYNGMKSHLYETIELFRFRLTHLLRRIKRKVFDA